MNAATHMKILFIFVYICIIAHQTHSTSIGRRNSIDEIGRESEMNDEFDTLEESYAEQIHPWLGKRIIDSAEKYFDWAGKTNRPMEYLRGKRFWLFAKKDEQGGHHETAQETGTPSNSVKQGIWRSGIVGRRRRR
ncbi:hypothetical protein I4U23_017894 [Adineta vaga]|nr:hypothetical protein I4U23_017894 [Adineta vaga]